jgi:putative FmdB family regulatory protein
MVIRYRCSDQPSICGKGGEGTVPIYHFECQQCGQRFEELAAYDRRDQVLCPACHSATRVLLSAFAVKGGSTGSVGAPSAPARSPFT